MIKKNSFISSLAVFVGTVIGVGIFSLPYVAYKAGFSVAFFYFLVMGGVSLATHFIFGEVAWGTDGVHRFPGYAEKYLGNGWKEISLIIIGLGWMGTLLAYLILGGSFLHSFFSPFLGGSEVLYSLVFFGLGSYLIYRGIKSVSHVELVLLGLLFFILVLFCVKAWPFLNIENLKPTNLKYLYLPYGVTLFALWGTAIVPEVKEMVGGSHKKLRWVIFTGIIISLLTYLLFTFLVLSISGSNTTPEAISGFIATIGDGVLRLAFIFGAISAFTSFITIGLTLRKSLWYDFGVPPRLAWGITSFIPLALFLFGLRQFIEIIGFTGALMLGASGIITVFIYRKFLIEKFSKKMNSAFYIIAAVYIVGIVFEILHFIL